MIRARYHQHTLEPPMTTQPGRCVHQRTCHCIMVLPPLSHVLPDLDAQVARSMQSSLHRVGASAPFIQVSYSKRNDYSQTVACQAIRIAQLALPLWMDRPSFDMPWTPPRISDNGHKICLPHQTISDPK